MGQLVLGIVGGVIGAFFGMPQLGFLVGSLLGSLLFPGKGQSGPRLTDLHVTSSTYGAPIPMVWGTVRMGGNVIWANDIKETKHKHSAGKGGPSVTTYTYSWSGAVGICTGPINNVLKIWADTKLVYDSSGRSGKVLNKYKMKFRVYKGTETQIPDVILETKVGAANAQAHRGMAYVVFDDIPLTDYGNRVPNFTFEVISGAEVSRAQGIEAFDAQDFAVHGVSGTVALPDWNRNRVFFLSEGNESTRGIRAFKLDTGGEYMEADLAHIYGPASGKWINSQTGGGCTLGKDGFIYLVSDIGNTVQMAKINPDSLTVAGYYGIAGSGLVGAAGVQAPWSMTSIQVPNIIQPSNWIVAGGFFGLICVFNSDTMRAGGHAFQVDEARVRVCPGPTRSDKGYAFALGHGSYGPGANSTPLGLYQVVVNEVAVTYDPALWPDAPNQFITTTKMGSITPEDINPHWHNFSDVMGLTFDSSDENVIAMVSTASHPPVGESQHYIIKIDTSTAAIIWKTPVNAIDIYGNTSGMQMSSIIDGVYAFASPAATSGIIHPVYIIDTASGVTVVEDWNGFTPGGAQVFDDESSSIIVFSSFSNPLSYPVGLSGFYFGNYFLVGLHTTYFNKWARINVGRTSGNGLPLSQVVSEICETVQLVQADLDVTDLEADTVEGYIVPSQMSVKDALAPLSSFYQFDGVESDYLLKFVKRGHDSIVTIPFTDLAVMDSKTNMRVRENRVQEVELPIQLSIGFLDPNRDYQAATVYARRPFNPVPTMHSNNRASQDIPLVATPQKARQVAETILYSTWLNRTTYSVKLPWQYLIYDPTDVVNLAIAVDANSDARFATMNVGADLTIEGSFAAEDSASYISEAEADGGDGFENQIITIPGATKWLPIDSPFLRDTDDTGNGFMLIYYGGGGYVDTWPGLELFKSADRISYVDVGGIKTGSTWGNTVQEFGDTTNPFATDYDNTLTVLFHEGEANLASITYTEMLNGGNAGVLIKADGTVEVIQFQNATQNDDGTWTFDTILRGRRGTDTMTNGHTIGEVFVFFTPVEGISIVEMAISELNATRFYRPTTKGTLMENADTIGFASTGRPLKPYAPANVAAALSGSDIDLTWFRRTRLGGSMFDFISEVPLHEETERYEVDIFNALGDTVLRTLSVNYGATPTLNPGVTYLAADITTDFGSTPTTLTVAVYQMSAAVGRGFAKKVVVDVE